MSAAATPIPALAELLRAAGPHVAELLERLEERLLEAAVGTPVLGEYAAVTVSAGGKRLRPLLVLLAAHGREASEEGLLRAAVAVELVHSATLVHDDVLDSAPLRRGHPSVVAAAGRGAATATGDLLFARAFAQLARGGSAPQVRSLSRAAWALARGELLQREDAWRADVSIDRYLLRCELKTASLFAAACELGALEAGADPEPLAAFGRRVGLAFQMLDDVLDVVGPPERTGKPRGTDLLDGTVNLPLLIARDRDPQIAAIELRSIGTPEAAAAVCDQVAATGALDEARTRALAVAAEAKAGLAELAAGQRDLLGLVADAVVERYT